MFHRKDVVPLVFLVLVIITIMVTLSQILVVHNKHHHVQSEPRDYQKFKDILVQLEGHINSMLKKNVLPLHKYRKSFTAQIYAERINSLLNKERTLQYGDKESELKTKRFKKNLEASNHTRNKHIKDKYHTRRKLSRIDYVTRELKGNCSSASKVYSQTSLVNEDKYPPRYPTVKEENTDDHTVTSNQIVNAKENSLAPFRSLLIRDKEVLDDSLPHGIYQNKKGIQNSLLRNDFPEKDSLSYGNKIEKRGSKLNRNASRFHRKGERYKLSCPEFPPNLIGAMRVRTTANVTRLTFRDHGDVKSGGHWRPVTCIPRHKVAIIVPYRDRQTHLHTLLFYLIPVLQRQQIEFRIFVIEQAGNRTFNKGMVMNVGFKEAVRMSDYHCYVFHDVDLIPEDDRNMYSCPGFPRHLSVAVDKFRYHLPYSQLVGGVFAIRREDFETVNGYSNLYWGWGAEDDDMSIRLAVAGMKLARPSATIARYKMLKHNTRERAPIKWSAYLLKTVKKRFHKDGLSSITYNVTSIQLEPYYTHIMVDIGDPPGSVGNISAIIR